eukprot:4760928-Pyramimonas_sp.AAC.1
MALRAQWLAPRGKRGGRSSRRSQEDLRRAAVLRCPICPEVEEPPCWTVSYTHLTLPTILLV